MAPAPVNHYVVEYRAVGGTDLTTLNAAVNALIATNPRWQPWGSIAVTGGTGDTHHQAMVRFGPQQDD